MRGSRRVLTFGGGEGPTKTMRYGRTAAVLAAALLLLCSCGSAAVSNDRTPSEVSSERLEETGDELLKVYFLDVGQGDCTLIQNGGHTMLIDAGDNDKEALVLEYLIGLDVERLDYLVLTHTDADHIGGADVVLTHFPVGEVLMGDYPKENDTYRDVLDALEDKGLSFSTPAAGDIYELGDASFLVTGPCREYDTPNNTSLSLLLRKGDHSFLFTGDAEREAELDMAKSERSLRADVYQVGHHGSFTSSTEELLDAAEPEYAVISCGAGNDYGYPHEEVLARLAERSVTVYRTDEQGSILALCDGETIRFDCPSGLGELSSAVTYVCNIHTKKFHLPDCEMAGKISEHNRLEVCLPREAVTGMGYTPCGACDP